MQSIKKIIFSLLIFSSSIFFAMSDQAGNVSQKVVEAAAEVLGQAVEYVPTIKDAVPYMGVAAQLYGVGADIKAYCFPSGEGMRRAIEVDEALVVVKTKRKLRNCLLANTSSQKREPFGRPTECEMLARILVKYGEKDAVAHMTAMYNKNIK